MNEESKEKGPRVIEQRDDLQNNRKNNESAEVADMTRKREDSNSDQMNCSQKPSNQKTD